MLLTRIKSFILFPLFFTLFLASCIGNYKPTKEELPSPDVKTTINISLSTISNISKIKTSYDVFTISNLIIEYAQNYDFNQTYSDIEETNTNDTSIITNAITNITNNFEANSNNLMISTISNNNITNNSENITLMTNITNISESNKSEILQKDLKIDIDTLIQKTLTKDFKTFVKSLGRYNPNLDEIKILNIDKIEKVLITNIIRSKSKLTNLIFSVYETNHSYLTNYSLTNEITEDGNTNTKVSVEVIEISSEVETKKISNDFLRKFVFTNTPWVLKVTNGITFSESKEGDISLSIFYELYTKPLSKYSTNFFVKLYTLVSNSFITNVYLYTTNILLEDLLRSDYEIFDGIRPIIYSYRYGELAIQVEPNDYNIYVDDFLVGRGKINLKYIMEGRHKVAFGRWNYKVNEWIEVKPGVVNFYKKRLLNVSSNAGILTIKSTPQEADTFVESEYYGKTPLTLELPQGQYRLRLQKGELLKFSTIDLIGGKTNEYDLKLENLKDKTSYKIMVGITTFLGITSVSSIFLSFWADSQERYYNTLYQQDPNNTTYRDMQQYYYYFKEDMRTTAITASILTFVTWGVTLGIESDKFFMKTSIRF